MEATGSMSWKPSAYIRTRFCSHGKLQTAESFLGLKAAAFFLQNEFVSLTVDSNGSACLHLGWVKSEFQLSRFVTTGGGCNGLGSGTYLRAADQIVILFCALLG